MVAAGLIVLVLTAWFWIPTALSLALVAWSVVEGCRWEFFPNSVSTLRAAAPMPQPAAGSFRQVQPTRVPRKAESTRYERPMRAPLNGPRHAPVHIPAAAHDEDQPGAAPLSLT